MLRLKIEVVLRTDEADVETIARELKRRLETLPALRQELIKAIAVLSVEQVANGE